MSKHIFLVSSTMIEVELQGSISSSLMDGCGTTTAFAALYMEVR